MWNRLRCMLTQRLNRTMGKNDINIEDYYIFKYPKSIPIEIPFMLSVPDNYFWKYHYKEDIENFLDIFIERLK